MSKCEKKNTHRDMKRILFMVSNDDRSTVYTLLYDFYNSYQ